MRISEQQMTELAHACRLSLTPEEIVQYARDLEELEAIASVLPASFVSAKRQEDACTLMQMRDDRVLPCLSGEAMLQNTPVAADGYILVPRTVEEA